MKKIFIVMAIGYFSIALYGKYMHEEVKTKVETMDFK